MSANSSAKERLPSCSPSAVRRYPPSRSSSHPSSTKRARYGARTSAGTARKRATSRAGGASARPSSRILSASSSSIALREAARDVPDRVDGGRPGVVVERGRTGSFGVRHALVERDEAGDLEAVGPSELLQRGAVALVADLVRH